MNRKELEEQITAYMTANPAPLSADDLQGAIALSDKDQDLYEEVMKDLEENGVIVRTRFDTFGLPQAMGLVTGRCQVTSKGFGFVVPLVKMGTRTCLFRPIPCPGPWTAIRSWPGCPKAALTDAWKGRLSGF